MHEFEAVIACCNSLDYSPLEGGTDAFTPNLSGMATRWFCFFVGDPTPSVPAETVNDGHSLVNKAALDLNLAPGSVLGKRTLINDLDAANKKLKTQDSSQTSSFSSADATSKLLLSGMAKEAANLKLPAYET